MIKELTGETPIEEAVLFAEVALKYPDLFAFDWDAAWYDATEPIEPWEWEWKPKARGMLQSLIGRPDVTTWTTESADTLKKILAEPAEEHRSLLDLQESVTQLLPTVPSTVSAEGDA